MAPCCGAPELCAVPPRARARLAGKAHGVMARARCAGKAHDVMALKCRGGDSPLNFAMAEYAELLPMLAKLSKARARAAWAAPWPAVRVWLELMLQTVSEKECISLCSVVFLDEATITGTLHVVRERPHACAGTCQVVRLHTWHAAHT